MGVSIEVRLRGERSFQSQRKNTMGWEVFWMSFLIFTYFRSYNRYEIYHHFFWLKLIWSRYKLCKKEPNFKILDNIVKKRVFQRRHFQNMTSFWVGIMFSPFSRQYKVRSYQVMIHPSKMSLQMKVDISSIFGMFKNE